MSNLNTHTSLNNPVPNSTNIKKLHGNHILMIAITSQYVTIDLKYYHSVAKKY